MDIVEDNNQCMFRCGPSQEGRDSVEQAKLCLGCLERGQRGKWLVIILKSGHHLCQSGCYAPHGASNATAVGLLDIGGK
jgi:hypothetical protein